MKITTCLNTTEKEVLAKKFNIIIGISIGNKYFTKENIRDYLLWAVKNTKEKVAILIPDKIHAVNYEVRSGYKKERSLKRAINEGEKIENIAKDIIEELPFEKHSVMSILKWEDIETEEYKRRVSVLYDEFKDNSKFRNEIIEIVKEYCNSEKLTDCDYEKLATYPLEELPMLVCGTITKIPSIYTIPIGFDLFIDPMDPGKYLNHSCEPSCGIKNRTQIVAMSDLKKDEEITIDYAMFVPTKQGHPRVGIDAPICRCGAKNRREQFGNYEELSDELREKYKGYISDYLI